MKLADINKLIDIFVDNLGKSDIEFITIFGEAFDMGDVKHVMSDKVVLSVKTWGTASTPGACGPTSATNDLLFSYVERVIDNSKNVTLYQKSDPLFDVIKQKFGYKMHESEIWEIVEMARDMIGE